MRCRHCRRRRVAVQPLHHRQFRQRGRKCVVPPGAIAAGRCRVARNPQAGCRICKTRSQSCNGRQEGRCRPSRSRCASRRGRARLAFRACAPIHVGLQARTSYKWAASSAGRAPRSQRGGREFDPPAVHQTSLPSRRAANGLGSPAAKRHDEHCPHHHHGRSQKPPTDVPLGEEVRAQRHAHHGRELEQGKRISTWSLSNTSSVVSCMMPVAAASPAVDDPSLAGFLEVSAIVCRSKRLAATVASGRPMMIQPKKAVTGELWRMTRFRNTASVAEHRSAPKREPHPCIPDEGDERASRRLAGRAVHD